MKDYELIKEEIAQEAFKLCEQSMENIIKRLKLEVPSFIDAEFGVARLQKTSSLVKINGVELKGLVKGTKVLVEKDELKSALIEMDVTQKDLILLVEVLKSDNFSSLLCSTGSLTHPYFGHKSHFSKKRIVKVK